MSPVGYSYLTIDCVLCVDYILSKFCDTVILYNRVELAIYQY